MKNLRFDLAGAFIAGVALMAAFGYALWHNYARPNE